jgi:hypothetical protein
VVRMVVLVQGLPLSHILTALRLAKPLRALAMVHTRSEVNPDLGVRIAGALDSSNTSIPIAPGPGRVLVTRLSRVPVTRLPGVLVTRLPGVLVARWFARVLVLQVGG